MYRDGELAELEVQLIKRGDAAIDAQVAGGAQRPQIQGDLPDLPGLLFDDLLARRVVEYFLGVLHVGQPAVDVLAVLAQLAGVGAARAFKGRIVQPLEHQALQGGESYVLLGACWLIMKTEGDLQQRAVQWARIAWPPVVLGFVLISMATPWISATVRARWFAMPEIIALSAIPLMTGVSLLAVRGVLGTRLVRGPICWLPFVLLILVFVLGFLGLAYSIYPFVVIDRLTIWQAASGPAALKAILIGVCIAVPAIVGYTVFAYRVFRGKTGELKYA